MSSKIKICHCLLNAKIGDIIHYSIDGRSYSGAVQRYETCMIVNSFIGRYPAGSYPVVSSRMMHPYYKNIIKIVKKNNE